MYRIAGIDVHKKMLAVVVTDVEIEGEYQFERRRFGSNPEHLRLLAEWFIEQQVTEVVMESTAQYWQRSGGAGTVLETNLPGAEGVRSELGNAASGASAIKSRTTRAQEGFS